MATKVGEFFIDLAVDAASGNLSVKQLIGALGELDVVSVTSVGVVAKITDTLWGLAKAATETAVEMSVLSDITGMDPKLVQQWEKAAQRININAGSIIKSIQGVHTMMGEIAARKQGPPMELTGWLGITPQKGVDPMGRPVMKSFFDLMREIADPKNRYWGYTPQVQQTLLKGIFPGGDPKDLFRILNEMRAGRFRPEDVSVLKKGQVDELTELERKKIEIGQLVNGMFRRMLVSGGDLAKILDDVAKGLRAFDKWIGSEQSKEFVEKTGDTFSGILRSIVDPFPRGTESLTRQFLARQFGLPSPVPVPSIAPVSKLGELSAKLAIIISGQYGNILSRKDVFLKENVSNTDVEQVTINAGNGGQGQ